MKENRREERDTSSNGEVLAATNMLSASPIALNMCNLNNHESNEEQDMITNLPESIISHILSCLPMKFAVRTSVLSRAWKYKWTCVTHIHLNVKVIYWGCSTIEREEDYIEFINNALFYCDLNMESFRLDLSPSCYVSELLIKSWITRVLKRGVKKLSINAKLHLNFSLNPASSHLLPSNNSYCLEVLELDMNGFDLRVPQFSFYFRHLKFLKLIDVIFSFDSPSGSNDVTLEFPALKELDVIDCDWLDAKSATLNVPVLERIYVSNVESYLNQNPLEAYEEASDICAIKICAQHIKEFTFADHKFQDISLIDPSSIKDGFANISIYKCGLNAVEEWVYACELLKQFSQVQGLQLHILTLAQSDVSLTVFPQFERLTHLKLKWVCGENLFVLLHRLPFLKTLEIEQFWHCDEEMWNSVTMPSHLLSTLEVMKLHLNLYFDGYQSESELCLAVFLLKHALRLKRMSFYVPRYDLKSKSMEEFKKKLFSSRQDSNVAIIDFCVNDNN